MNEVLLVNEDQPDLSRLQFYWCSGEYRTRDDFSGLTAVHDSLRNRRIRAIAYVSAINLSETETCWRIRCPVVRPYIPIGLVLRFVS
jgi:hypothetical protein